MDPGEKGVMKDPGTPQDDSRKPMVPQACSLGIHQTQSGGAKSYDTCRIANYHVPCTATADELCHIIDQLTQWNAVLFPARFELRELPHACGRLSLSNFYNAGLDLPDPSEPELSRSGRALYWLLTTHHCIVSLHITAWQCSICETLCDALRRNTSLKSLRLYYLDMAIQTGLAEVIQCLTRLEELECFMHREYHANFVTALCTFLRTSLSLTSLRLQCFLLEEQAIKGVLAALMDSATLRKFNMSTSLAVGLQQEEFTIYLRFPMMLTTLRITAINDEMQRSLLQGILQNRTISSLTIIGFICNAESAQLMARIFRENEVLLAFSIASKQEGRRPDGSRPDGSGNYNWIAALAENDTLEELSLPLSIWPAATWAIFFRVLSTKPRLTKVHIDMNSVNATLLSLVCRALAESGAEERVSCRNYRVINNVELIKCRAFSGVYFLYGANENVRLKALRQLPQCAHISYLAMNVSKGNTTLSSALADYVQSAPHLRKLQLIVGCVPDMVENLPNEWWTVIVKSISASSSIRQLVICSHGMETEGIEELADSVRHNQSITMFIMKGETTENTCAFVTRLSTGITDNYTLRRVGVRGRVHGRLDAEATRSWFAVSETTRRNSGILARAVLFTDGRQFNRYVAGALECVSLHSTLMEDLAEMCHVNKDAMAVSVQACIRSFESMDAFMRLAGVVRERVFCHPRDDGHVQLDQLNEYCWSHVRRYLVLDDVKSSAIQTTQARGRLESTLCLI